MSFRGVSIEPASASETASSSAVKKLDDALGVARDLIEVGIDIRRIENIAGAVVRDADEVKARLAKAAEAEASSLRPFRRSHTRLWFNVPPAKEASC